MSDQGKLHIKAILFERGYRKRTAEENARFANLIDKQYARDRARGLLLLAEHELDYARRAVDDPTMPLAERAPTVESVEAEKAAEIATSKRLVGYAAHAARQFLHRRAYTSEEEDKAVQALGAVLAEKAPLNIAAAAEDIGPAEWEILARVAISWLGLLPPKEEPR